MKKWNVTILRYPRILIGCPTSYHKEYCLERYITGLKNIQYPNFDILLVDNSDNDEYYKKITKTFGDYKKIVENVRYLYQEKVKMGHHLHINSKIVDTGLSEHDFKKFKNDFGPISDSLTVESLMGWSKSFVKDFTIGKEISYGIDYQSKLNSIEVCPQPFKGLAVNFDGTVSICCVDWSHGTLVGDTKKESIVDIWFGQKLREFRLMHLRKERNKISACADCHYIKGHKPEAYLDHKTEELIKIYEN